jgi:hypothetical protein
MPLIIFLSPEILSINHWLLVLTSIFLFFDRCNMRYEFETND